MFDPELATEISGITDVVQYVPTGESIDDNTASYAGSE